MVLLNIDICLFIISMLFFFQNCLQHEAIEMMSTIVRWMKEDDSDLGHLALKADKSTSSLANPVMLMCLIDQMRKTIPEIVKTYEKLEEECCLEIIGHIQVSEIYLKDLINMSIYIYIYIYI